MEQFFNILFNVARFLTQWSWLKRFVRFLSILLTAIVVKGINCSRVEDLKRFKQIKGKLKFGLIWSRKNVYNFAAINLTRSDPLSKLCSYIKLHIFKIYSNRGKTMTKPHRLAISFAVVIHAEGYQ